MNAAKIKCRDLMVGDWITNRNGFSMQITNVGDDYAYATFEGNEGDPWEFDDKDDQPEPIPLTPEILEKNGFSPDTFLTAEWERKVYFKEFPGCVVEPADSGKYIFGTTKYWSKKYSDGSPIDWGTMYDSRICNLQYVHELQHALRLCGLNEIADNFKV